MKIFLLVNAFILFSVSSTLAGSKPSVPKNPVKKVKEKVTDKINNSDLKKEYR